MQKDDKTPVSKKHSHLDHQAGLESVAEVSARVVVWVEVWDEVEQLKKDQS